MDSVNSGYKQPLFISCDDGLIQMWLEFPRGQVYGCLINLPSLVSLEILFCKLKISDLLHKRVKLEFKLKWNLDLAYNFSDVSKYV